LLTLENDLKKIELASSGADLPEPEPGEHHQHRHEQHNVRKGRLCTALIAY
jgi:hypothetical protein